LQHSAGFQAVIEIDRNPGLQDKPQPIPNPMLSKEAEFIDNRFLPALPAIRRLRMSSLPPIAIIGIVIGGGFLTLVVLRWWTYPKHKD